jgi:hypothetical protein
MPKNFYYTLALRTGGLMEDPDWHYQNIATIRAHSLKEAKDIWAEKQGYIKDKDWDKVQQTWWGWSVVCLGSNDKKVEITIILPPLMPPYHPLRTRAQAKQEDSNRQ